jgi:hypothetical protein
MECFVYNWRILLGGAASAAILTAGVAAPAFAQAQDVPVSLSGLNSASGVLCGLASLPVSGEVSAAAKVIGASCGSLSSSSPTTGSAMIQANGPMRASGAASSSLPGLNSVSGSVPAFGNAAGAAPGVANPSGTHGHSASASTGLSSHGSSSKSGSSAGASTGLGSVTGTLSGVTGGLQNGGSISTPLSGVTGG